jgi:formate hydrogenlyase subunit 3/multisubunit Na+/H+ antiporter MnhD subunit
MMPYILLLSIVVPGMVSVFIFLTRYQMGRKAGWIAGGGLLFSSVLLLIGGMKVYQGEIIAEQYPFVGPNISFDLLGDGLSIACGLIINLLCAALAFYSIHYVEHRIEVIYGDVDEKTWLSYYAGFYSLFLGFPIGFMGVCFVRNLIAMYFFLEVLPLVLYFLMAYYGYIERVRVALMCLLWASVGAVFFLSGILLIFAQTNNFNISGVYAIAGNPKTFWIILLILIGLLTKMAVFPFHSWMPWVHAEHPTCIAGLLAVYANIAAYIMVRVLIMPLHEDFKVFSIPLMVMALFTMVYGSFLTMAQDDVKRFAACSTVSQISYSLFGIAALTTYSVEGGMFFFLSHIMGKTILFSTAGLLVYATHTRDIREMGGLGSKLPITMLLWACGSMMLSGFPPFSGFPAEWIMFTGIFQKGVQDPTAMVAAILGVSAIALTVSYTFWGMKRIFFGPLAGNLATEKIKDPPLTMTVPLLFVAGVSITLGLYPKLIMNLLHLVIGGSLPS